MYENDKRIVLTLDAGGTNFVFSAVQGYEEVVNTVTMPSFSDDLEKCLNMIVAGFEEVKSQLSTAPIAISFAFPGPADYKKGIIGDLPNFKSFRGGVALGPFLEKKFNIPVYINNDGNLFAYGEALAGALPLINKWLQDAGNPKIYHNLMGFTLGTGFGAGVTIDNKLLLGDNGGGGNVWTFRNKKYPGMIVEESVSIRAVKRVYAELSGLDSTKLSPKDIFDIAEGVTPGNQLAAIRSFEELGEMAGDAIASVLSIVDGIVVLGGGLSGASEHILPCLIKELRSNMSTFGGDSFSRMEISILNLMESFDKEQFLSDQKTFAKVPFSEDIINYENSKKVGVFISQIGANRAIMFGAYAYALQQIDSNS